MSRYLIAIDSISQPMLEMAGKNKDDLPNLINLNLKKKNDLHNSLYEKFQEFPTGSEVLIYLKIHGSEDEKENQEKEILQSVNDPKLLINSSEITKIVGFGRNVKGFKICGILHICHGYTYKNLINCFDICISSEKKEMGGGPGIVRDIVNFYKDCENFYDGFENKLYQELSSSLTGLAWAFGEAETQDEKRWLVTKNLENIKMGNFIKIWKNVINNEKILLTELTLRNFLISNGFTLNYLMNNFHKEDELTSFIINLMKFNDKAWSNLCKWRSNCNRTKLWIAD